MGLYTRGLEKIRSSGVSQGESVLQKGTVEKKKFFRTDIDRFYHLVEVSPEGVSHEKVLEILDASSSQVEEWGRVLERQGVLTVRYTSVGGIVYVLQSGREEGVFDFVKTPLSFKMTLFLGFFVVLFLGLGIGFYFFPQAPLFSFLAVANISEVSDVSEDVGIALETAFSGLGGYTCTVTIGDFVEVYSLNYSDMHVAVFYQGNSSSSVLYLGDAQYSYNGSVWENRSLVSTDIGPGRVLPTYDRYTCVQDFFNISLFEVPI